MTWLVAVDGSESSNQAFKLAVQMMDKKMDILYVLGVVERVTHIYPVAPPFFNAMHESELAIEKETRKRLQCYATQCMDLKIQNWSVLMGTSSFIGELICKACEVKDVDTLVVGRSGSKLASILTGSTSKYCVEHANCNVLVAKVELPQEEIHVDKAVVIRAEEKERARREKEEKDQIELESQTEKIASELNRNISRMAEDEERRRRTKEEEEVHRINAEKEAKLIDTAFHNMQERKMKQNPILLDEKSRKHSDLYELVWDESSDQVTMK